ncbi:Formamidopyrimidine-DNA glycosylase [Phycisphaerae bacterium RAS1]|nr:Formamidopyrimidine-DNA glycosylase [Phycisphaerae bacterium RAS1]
MPELPEVETVVRATRDRLVGRRIVGFESCWPRQVSPDAASLTAAVVGRRVDALSRRGKFIAMRLHDGGFVLIHLRMSGRLAWDDGGPAVAHLRAVFSLDDGSRLLFCDARKFGRIIYTADYDSFSAKLGAEPLDRGFTPARLGALLTSRARRIKPLLLDQSVVAGLGNIYTDESLFRAGIHPLRRSDSLSKVELRRLHTAIRAVLRDGVRRNGASIDWVYPGGSMQEMFRVYGRAGQPCDVCGTPILALRVGGRGTHICPRCQPRRRPASAAPRRRVSKRTCSR